jgi:hypothetical protein
MKRYILNKITLLALLAIAWATGSATMAQDLNKRRVGNDEVFRFTGTIQSINPQRKTITLINGRTSQSLSCVEGCTFNVADKTNATLAEFHAGDTAVAYYTKKGGEVKCFRFELAPPVYLQVESNPPGASVEIGLQHVSAGAAERGSGRNVGRTPCTVELKPSDVNRTTGSIICRLEKLPYYRSETFHIFAQFNPAPARVPLNAILAKPGRTNALSAALRKAMRED